MAIPSGRTRVNLELGLAGDYTNGPILDTSAATLSVNKPDNDDYDDDDGVIDLEAGMENLEALSAEKTIVKVCEYNIQSFPRWLQTLLRYSPLGRVRHMLNADAFRDDSNDVIVFTEAFSAFSTKFLRDELQRRGYSYSKKPRQLCRLNGGVFICVKTPIERQLRHVFKRGTGWDRIAAKGLVYVETVINDKKFGIVGTHLQSNSGPKEQSIRKSQLLEIREFLNRNARQVEVLIVAGDLNINFDTSEYHDMQRILNAYDIDLVKDQGGTAWMSFDPESDALAKNEYPTAKSEHLDYVLVLKDSTANQTSIVMKQETTRVAGGPLQQDLSDHHAIVGQFKLTNAPTATTTPEQVIL